MCLEWDSKQDELTLASDFGMVVNSSELFTDFVLLSNGSKDYAMTDKKIIIL